MALKLAAQIHPQSKILMIDDDIDQHNLAMQALKHDYSLVCESSGSGAIATAMNEKPELILLDLQMPHVDGFEVLEQLKRHPVLSAIPVFCLTASDDEMTRARCYNAGAAGFIKKPIDIKTIAQDISKTLKNLSNILYSDDKKNSVLIGINETELSKQFQQIVHQQYSHGKKIVSLSIRDGVFFADSSIEQMVNKNEVIYIQIKPSLMTRLPFIDDLNIVMSDLKKLLDAQPGEYSVVIERPEIFLLSPGNDNKTATILAFSEAMNKTFSEVHYLCKKPTAAFDQPAVTEMSKLLVRQF